MKLAKRSEQTRAEKRAMRASRRFEMALDRADLAGKEADDACNEAELVVKDGYAVVKELEDNVRTMESASDHDFAAAHQRHDELLQGVRAALDKASAKANAAYDRYVRLSDAAKAEGRKSKQAHLAYMKELKSK